MKTENRNKFALSLLTAAILSAPSAFAADSDIGSALTDGKLSANFNLRYEGVQQDNALKDADALTLRTRLNYTTGTFNGFSAAVELENSVAIIDDYNNAIGNGTEYSVIADPDHTELDQAYIAYKNDKFSGKFVTKFLIGLNELKGRWWSDLVLMPVAAIGGASILNTFCHAHTPLFINL